MLVGIFLISFCSLHVYSTPVFRGRRDTTETTTKAADASLISGSIGKDVVIRCLHKLEVLKVFSNEYSMIKRIAYYETRFGANYTGRDMSRGMWQIPDWMRNKVQSSESKPVVDSVSSVFVHSGASLSDLPNFNLGIPFHSATIVRLYVKIIQGSKPIPQSIDEQGIWWATHYNKEGSSSDFKKIISEYEGSKDCTYQKMDLWFMIDGTNSVGKDNFETALDFVKHVSRYIWEFIDDSSDFRVGFSVLTSSMTIHSKFNQHMTKTELFDVVGGIQYPDESDNKKIGQAITDIVKDGFAQENGARAFSDLVPRAIMIITPGKSLDDVEEPSSKARSEDIALFAVALGTSDYQDNLNIIANDPDSSYSLTISDFNELVATLKKMLCQRILVARTTPAPEDEGLAATTLSSTATTVKSDTNLKATSDASNSKQPDQENNANLSNEDSSHQVSDENSSGGESNSQTSNQASGVNPSSGKPDSQTSNQASGANPSNGEPDSQTSNQASGVNPSNGEPDSQTSNQASESNPSSENSDSQTSNQASGVNPSNGEPDSQTSNQASESNPSSENSDSQTSNQASDINLPSGESDNSISNEASDSSPSNATLTSSSNISNTNSSLDDESVENQAPILFPQVAAQKGGSGKSSSRSYAGVGAGVAALAAIGFILFGLFRRKKKKKQVTPEVEDTAGTTSNSAVETNSAKVDENKVKDADFKKLRSELQALMSSANSPQSTISCVAILEDFIVSAEKVTFPPDELVEAKALLEGLKKRTIEVHDTKGELRSALQEADVDKIKAALNKADSLKYFTIWNPEDKEIDALLEKARSLSQESPVNVLENKELFQEPSIEKSSEDQKTLQVENILQDPLAEDVPPPPVVEDALQQTLVEDVPPPPLVEDVPPQPSAEDIIKEPSIEDAIQPLPVEDALQEPLVENVLQEEDILEDEDILRIDVSEDVSEDTEFDQLRSKLQAIMSSANSSENTTNCIMIIQNFITSAEKVEFPSEELIEPKQLLATLRANEEEIILDEVNLNQEITSQD